MLRRATLGGLAALALVFAAPASAAPPPVDGLTFLQCVEHGAAGSPCEFGHPTLALASDVAVSPDGRNVYVTSASTDAVAIFNRGAGGRLTPAGCIESTGGSACGPEGTGLRRPASLTVSPDGQNVYVVGNEFEGVNEDTLVVLDRAADGSLSYDSCWRGGATPAGCSALTGFDGGTDVAVSPDGGNVYATGYTGSGVVKLVRGGGGTLSSPATSTSPLLSGPEALAVDPSGNKVHVAGIVSDNVVSFTRGAAGALGAAQCIENPGAPVACTATAAGLDDPNGLSFAPGGRVLHVSASASDTVASLNHSPAGVLSAGSCTRDPSSSAPCTGVAEGLNWVSNLAASRTGAGVYAITSNNGDNGITALSRGGQGLLRFLNCFHDGVTPGGCGPVNNNIASPNAVEVSPDGRNVYLASFGDSMVDAFRVERGPACTASGGRTRAPAAVAIRLTCSDPDGDPLSVSPASTPSGGTLGAVNQATRTVTYTPRRTFSGTDRFTFRASDGTNVSTSATATVTVSAAPVSVPSIAGLRATRRRFRLGTKLPRLSARRVPTGTTIRFTLSRASRVTLAFQRVLTRKKKGRRGRRYAKAVNLRVNGKAGVNRLRFQGRISKRRKLRPGRYRLTLRAAADGRTSAPKRVRLTILPRARKRR